jgi:hypothetical protein
MANTFFPKPAIGGSNNVWATYLDMLVRAGGQGALTCELYNDSGTLKLSKGKIGIDNGVVEGVSVIDTITTISTAGMTANNWHKVEMTVSGTAVTIAIAAIAGATDESTIDTATKAAYDYEKAGYYLDPAKRLIGVVFLRAALALGRIVNCESGKLGFKGIRIKNSYTTLSAESQKYIAEIEIDVSAWNMDTTTQHYAVLPYAITKEVKSVITIKNNSGLAYSGNIGGLSDAWYQTVGGEGRLYMDRLLAGAFDNAGFNAATGIIIIIWET